jgi:hypothetical protein
MAIYESIYSKILERCSGEEQSPNVEKAWIYNKKKEHRTKPILQRASVHALTHCLSPDRKDGPCLESLKRQGKRL